MKKFLITAAALVLSAGSVFSQMMGGMHSWGMMQQPYGYYYQPMMPMMMMPMMMGGMMGGMMMMHDPETMKIIREHQLQCKKELMKKLASRPTFIEKMMHIMVMHPDAVKKALEKNPELKEKMRELLK